MAVTSKANKITLKAVIYEDQVPTIRKKLIKLAPEELEFNLTDCDDVHLAVIQQMLAYKKMYNCTFKFSDTITNYQKIIEGFSPADC
ncbi:hypothetical protein JHD50_07325 [Sulfurimonas sp. MAG313]|nr:hypothetical protein [Sulfurimonas sp. MAG313]MDF1881115.1 hypothetical protein [Sulfurimonas sp. MAG313]